MKPITTVLKNGYISPELFLEPPIKKHPRRRDNILSDIWQLFSSPPG